MKHYESRKDVGYEIQFYNSKGDYLRVTQCENLEEVAKCLIKYCNGNLKANLPTVHYNGELIRDIF
jgi:hypothetical protein